MRGIRILLVIESNRYEIRYFKALKAYDNTPEIKTGIALSSPSDQQSSPFNPQTSSQQWYSQYAYYNVPLLLLSAPQLLRHEARRDGAQRGARERAVRSLDERSGDARVRARLQGERSYEQQVLVRVGRERDTRHRRLDHLTAERVHRCVCSLTVA